MYDAFVVAIAVFVGVAFHELFGMAMFSRPIVVAPLAGLLMGDFATGLKVGASLEAIFMGVVNIGISSSAEPALAAGLATAFSIKMGGNIGAIVPIVFPLAVLGLQLMNMIFSFVCGPWASKFFKYAKEGDGKKITRLHFTMWFVHYGIYALIPFFAVLFGSDVVKSVLNSIPDVIMNGLTVAGNLLPAVGMAMLLRMLWRSDLSVYFFLGIVMMAYFKLPLIAIAVIGAIIAIIVAQNDLQFKKLKESTPLTSTTNNVTLEEQEEEDFFE
ncbi:PTS system sorbose-specific transporter subunit IIC [Lapidilactobacillus dextrinicus DSM 20335]|uniref:PTS system sorbose-specific transporter subunit IIC n=1 Tax=Lapidilactobacillus dextrinicus DSM 20335 TaxID=1423738 RepID=A0A0R2BHY1_9LACO|nr:PTS sugar transporter subunit IIC [Lapidilactobacillus dextrinicus]KRM78624.1 PTS system sorbose-specific transporter subunit IIC [Lapidilactobacillus dextrinicus DSM 20335]QFG46539.1 PTS sugar transporter subunit IIC [Lapidilactobacillus dextrinicus]